MKLNYWTILLFSLLFALQACNSNTNSDESDTVVTPPAAPTEPDLPFKNKGELSTLYQQVDHLDVIFFGKEFSMNVGGLEAKQKLIMVDLKPVVRTPCPESARMFFNGQGTEIVQVGLFLGQNCAYYVYYDKDGKPEAANPLTEGGIEFFNKLIQQVSVSPN